MVNAHRMHATWNIHSSRCIQLKSKEYHTISGESRQGEAFILWRIILLLPHVAFWRRWLTDVRPVYCFEHFDCPPWCPCMESTLRFRHLHSRATLSPPSSPVESLKDSWPKSLKARRFSTTSFSSDYESELITVLYHRRWGVNMRPAIKQKHWWLWRWKPSIFLAFLLLLLDSLFHFLKIRLWASSLMRFSTNETRLLSEEHPDIFVTTHLCALLSWNTPETVTLNLVTAMVSSKRK